MLSRIITLVLLIFSIGLFAQGKKDGLIGGKVIKKKTWTLKLSPIEAVNGDFNVRIEKETDFANIELGVGIILPYYIREVIQEKDGRDIIVNPTGGFSFRIEPRFFIDPYDNEYYYINPGFRFRSYSLESGVKFSQYDATIGGGHLFKIGFNWVIDPYIAVGLRFRDFTEVPDDAEGIFSSGRVGFITPVGVKFGYRF